MHKTQKSVPYNIKFHWVLSEISAYLFLSLISISFKERLMIGIKIIDQIWISGHFLEYIYFEMML